MLDFSDFIYIDSVKSRIGINEKETADIISRLLPGKIKKEHIEASSPALEVIRSPFYISKKLITVSEFTEFVETTSYISESEKEGWGWVWEFSWKKRDGVSWKTPFGNDADIIYLENASEFPVMQVSWNDAVAYTEWRSVIEGKQIRLPSEVEWEIFAGKAGVKSLSQSSNHDIKKSSLIHNSSEFISVLSKELKRSGYNIGLLWEWTLDWYNGYAHDVTVKDFGNVYKVLRGGSLLSEEIQKTKEFRFRRCPTARSPYYSFRIVFLND
jgi:formylglycine-generating enzyme required for sulfatase activity